MVCSTLTVDQAGIGGTAMLPMVTSDEPPARPPVGQDDLRRGRRGITVSLLLIWAVTVSVPPHSGAVG